MPPGRETLRVWSTLVAGFLLAVAAGLGGCTATMTWTGAIGSAQPASRPAAIVGNAATGPAAVAWTGPYTRGTIVVANSERALYLVGGGPAGKTLRYPVSVGSWHELWTGVEYVTAKKEYPPWMAQRNDGSRNYPVPGGDPANPLGDRALYLGNTLWRIHGTNDPELIGAGVSGGCIRMRNADVAHLYDRVPLGTPVYVVDRRSDPPPSHRGRKLVASPY